MIKVKALTTGYVLPVIPNYTYWGLQSFFTSYNSHTKDRDPFGIIENDKTVRVAKIDEEKLGSLIGTEFEIVNIPATPSGQLTTKMVMKNPPKDKIQAEVINNVITSFKDGHSRVVISLPTGQGKTYVATNIISQLNTPTLILVKNIELRKQWLESFYKHSNLKNIVVCQGSGDLITIYENSKKYDCIITTHRTLQNFINMYNDGMRRLNELIINQGIGLKVYDEFDLEADSTFKIETHTSVKYTIYLSATDYKSPNCNKVFQAVYGHLPNFGKEYGIKPDRNAIFVLYKSNPNKRLYNSCMRYTPDGFTMDYHKYHAYVVNHQSYKYGLSIIWEKIIKRSYYNKDHYLKTVFFIGRKTTAEKFKQDLIAMTGIKDKDIGVLNSDTNKADRDVIKKKKIIISTADSLGRGVDLENLDIVVDLETRASKSKTTQVIGRVSRSGAKFPGTYISFIDLSYPTVLRNYQQKVNDEFYETQFTNMRVLDLTKNTNDNKGEING